MSFLHAVPDAVKAAATDIAGIGTGISSANAAAALPTTGVVAAAADQVSAQVAAFFSSHAQGYQQLSEQVSAFHDRFVQALGSSAASYAAAESNAVQSLLSTLNAPAALAQPFEQAVAGATQAVAQVQSAFQNVGAKALSVLGLMPTGGIGGLAASNGLLGPLGALGTAAASPAAGILPVSWATAIKNAYNYFEPWVAYGFDLAAYAAGWVPYIGFLIQPQIYFFYDLFEPMVQSGLFNIVDWLSGAISFSQGLNNFFYATGASINFFIQQEINWFLSWLPPLPPIFPFP